jgi:hypothetical protein
MDSLNFIIKSVTSLLTLWLKPIEKFNNRFVSPVYKQSNDKYILDTSIGQYWISIGCGLEVSFRFSNNFCNTPSKIAIRNLNSAKIDKITVLLETKGYFDGYYKSNLTEKQEFLEFFDLRSTAESNNISLEKDLCQIPLLEVWRLQNGNIKLSYDDLSIKLLTVKTQGTEKTVDIEADVVWGVGGKLLTDIHRGNYEKRGVDFYHVGLINDAKEKLKMKIYCHFNPPPTYVSMATYLQVNLATRFYWSLRERLENFVCNLLTSEKIINLIFWYHIIISQCTIEDDGSLIST